MKLVTFVSSSKFVSMNVHFTKHFFLIFLIVCTCLNSTTAQSPCSSAAHSQFDFWLGEWEVYHSQADTLVGHNIINKILNDCVVMENWVGRSGFAGKSFNTYNPLDSTWNQVWVDVGGSTYHFKGKFMDNAMVLRGETIGRAGGKVLFEMSFHPDSKSENVRQVWKQSKDEGTNWIVIFDGTYKKKE